MCRCQTTGHEPGCPHYIGGVYDTQGRKLASPVFIGMPLQAAPTIPYVPKYPNETPAAFIGWLCQTVHQAYHQDVGGTWENCYRDVCQSAKFYLGAWAVTQLAIDSFQVHSRECSDGTWVSKICTRDLQDRVTYRAFDVEVREFPGIKAANHEDRADEFWFNSPEFCAPTRNRSEAAVLTWLADLLRKTP